MKGIYQGKRPDFSRLKRSRTIWIPPPPKVEGIYQGPPEKQKNPRAINIHKKDK
jgi:hypothetical protein